MATNPKKRGRPPKGAATKSESLLLRLEATEKAAFGDAAALAGVPLSVWIRERLRKIARRELEEANRPIPFLSFPKA